MKHTIDATNKKIGRIASEAASLLMGKKTPAYRRDRPSGIRVSIVNCSKADINEKKKQGKIYVTFTGFRGGIYDESLGHLITRKGASEAFRLAVYRMLPSNSLRKEMMKNLETKE
ncbi:MAG: uL13 family ribosomal protein [Patescibacteria group bacterium]|nr:uL13 family ribosomal protein [Patescibacteria group bacterium]